MNSMMAASMSQQQQMMAQQQYAMANQQAQMMSSMSQMAANAGKAPGSTAVIATTTKDPNDPSKTQSQVTFVQDGKVTNVSGRVGVRSLGCGVSVRARRQRQVRGSGSARGIGKPVERANGLDYPAPQLITSRRCHV
jgi:hypothetical protein